MTEENKKVTKKVTKKTSAKKVKLPEVPKNFGENFNGHLAKEDTCTILRAGHEIVQAQDKVTLQEALLSATDLKIKLAERNVREQELLLTIEKYKLEIAKLLREKSAKIVDTMVEKVTAAQERHNQLSKLMESQYGIIIQEYSFDLVDFSLVKE